MTTVSTKWNLGAFSVALKSELDQEHLVAIAPFALRYLAQRSKIDRALGAQVKKDGKWVAVMKRGDVPYSAEKADALAELFSNLADDDEAPTVSIAASATITEYVREKSEVKYKAEREKIASKGGSAQKLAALAAAVGFDYVTGTEASTLTVENVEFCEAIKAWVKRQMQGI